MPDHEDSLGGETFSGEEQQDAAEQSLGDGATIGDTAAHSLGEASVDDGMELVDLSTRYTEEGVLGKGGFGEVVLATDTRLNRKVAIKRIRGTTARSKTAVQRFLTEAQSIASLNHNNIVQIYDYGRSTEGPFLIMECVQGGSLFEKCKAGPIELDEAVNIFGQLCDGLAKAHAARIIHRDIKPANVLMSEDGIPKLTDFGLAKDDTADTGMTIDGAVIGTLDFMPPEQRQGAEFTDHRSDLWSLAATFYQMLTGEPPRVIDLDAVPTDLRPSFAKALKSKKEDRFQSAREMREEMLNAWKQFHAREKTLVAQKKRIQEEKRNAIPSNVEELWNIAVNDAENGRYKEAIASWSDAITLDPEFAYLYMARAYVYGQLGEFEKAIADCSKSLELNPDDAEAHGARGWACLQLEDIDKANADCSKAIELDPVHEYAYDNRGSAYLKAGEFEKAISDYSKALELNPESEDTRISLSFAYVQNGEFETAIAACAKAIELNPEQGDAYDNWGLACVGQGEFKKAIPFFTKAIELNPDNLAANMHEFYYNRGCAYHHLGEFGRSIADYTNSIELNPEFTEAFSKRGSAYQNLGEFENAIPDYSKAIELNPEDTSLYYDRGDTYKSLGEAELAKKDYLKADELKNERLSEGIEPADVPQVEANNKHITLECDACGKQFSVPPDYRGKKAKCSCGKILDI